TAGDGADGVWTSGSVRSVLVRKRRKFRDWRESAQGCGVRLLLQVRRPVLEHHADPIRDQWDEKLAYGLHRDRHCSEHVWKFQNGGESTRRRADRYPFDHADERRPGGLPKSSGARLPKPYGTRFDRAAIK